MSIQWSPFPRKQSTKNPQTKIGDDSEQDSGQNSDTNSKNSAFDLQLCDLNDSHGASTRTLVNGTGGGVYQA